jgi:hypothetical protein
VVYVNEDDEHERKALFEGLIYKIEIRADSTLLPHFRIPFADNTKDWPL